MRPLLGIAALAFLCLLSIPAAAHPREGSTKAQALYEQGTAEYNLGSYDAALTAFEGAYRLKPDPALLFNIAQCYRQLAKPDDAAREYRAYLRESPKAPNRAEVERLIQDMQNLVAAREANKPPTGVQPPSAPSPGTMPTPPVAATAPS
ncbi:MAG TPA: tetratricopeptide repeat protein, partial [Polyangia bacterium]